MLLSDAFWKISKSERTKEALKNELLAPWMIFSRPTDNKIIIFDMDVDSVNLENLNLDLNSLKWIEKHGSL